MSPTTPAAISPAPRKRGPRIGLFPMSIIEPSAMATTAGVATKRDAASARFTIYRRRPIPGRNRPTLRAYVA